MPLAITIRLAGLLLMLSIAGCSNVPVLRSGLPPVLTQDELIKPYDTIGRIQVVREVYGIIDDQIRPDIQDWALTALRAEAEKMGADALILPEVRGTTTRYQVIPSTEYRASGVAIKFK